MNGWICKSCGAEFKQEKSPEHCVICHKKKFLEHNFEEPTKQDKHSSKKYKEILNLLEKYEEGCLPRSTQDHICCCGTGRRRCKTKK